MECIGSQWVYVYIERGYCVYGDSCKFDHGEEQITVNDYSKFQAIMGSSGAMGMNPMIMQNPGNSIGGWEKESQRNMVINVDRR